jgi:hypothetical protein
MHPYMARIATRGLAAAALAMAAPGAGAATITVNDLFDGSGGCTLRRAVENVNATRTGLPAPHAQCAAADGIDDVVSLPAGTHVVNAPEIPLRGFRIVIRGAGMNATTVRSGDGQASLFDARSFGAGPGGVPSGEVTLSQMTIENFRAAGFGDAGDGGVLRTSSSTRATIDRVHLRNNEANADGGAIDADGEITITQSWFDSNRANSNGGALRARRTVTINNSTFSGNQAPRGGALSLQPTTATGGQLTNSTLTNNTAANEGGAIHYEGASGNFVSLFYSTVARNNAPSGAGVFLMGPGFGSTRSILAGNNGPDCSTTGATFASGNYNVFGTALNCIFTIGGQPNNSVVGDPLVADFLADNGGPTPTLALKPASLARSLVPLCGITEDQRGSPRINTAACDAGAFEAALESVPSEPTNVTAEPGFQSATVSFIPSAANGGSPITKYTVVASPAAPGGATIGNASPITVTGLMNGQSYTFRVFATNSLGDSELSVPSNAVVPAPQLPGAPVGISATAGHGSVSVGFSGTTSGSGPITKYTATCGGVSVDRAFSPIVVAPLPNGVSVTCTVIASNAFGASPASGPSNPVTPTALPFAYGDFDANLRGDLVFQHADGRVAAWLMNGTGIVATANIFGAGTGWTVTHLADLDGDAKADILFRHTDGRIYVYQMNGLAVAGGKELFGPGTGWTISHTADLNNDGRADLLLRHADGRAHIWLMNGTAIAGSASLLPAGSGWNVAGTGDLNGDSRADIVFMNDDGRGYIYLMNGTSIIGGVEFLAPGSGWTVSHVADLDGDGKADLMFRHADGRAFLYLMNGTAFGPGASVLGPGTGWTVTHMARGQVVFGHTDGRAHLRLMDGTATVAAGDILPANAGWRVTHLLDLNGDGKPDLVFRNDDGRITVRLMNGLAATASANLIGAGGWSVAPPGP